MVSLQSTDYHLLYPKFLHKLNYFVTHSTSIKKREWTQKKDE
jgi:hypothetical protein